MAALYTTTRKQQGVEAKREGGRIRRNLGLFFKKRYLLICRKSLKVIVKKGSMAVEKRANRAVTKRFSKHEQLARKKLAKEQANQLFAAIGVGIVLIISLLIWANWGEGSVTWKSLLAGSDVEF
jgi:hypothetical protein